MLGAAVRLCVRPAPPLSRQATALSRSSVACPRARRRALTRWYGERDWWNGLARRAMQMDWSWSSPALDYLELYYKCVPLWTTLLPLRNHRRLPVQKAAHLLGGGVASARGCRVNPPLTRSAPPPLAAGRSSGEAACQLPPSLPGPPAWQPSQPLPTLVPAPAPAPLSSPVSTAPAGAVGAPLPIHCLSLKPDAPPVSLLIGGCPTPPASGLSDCSQAPPRLTTKLCAA